MNQLPGVAHRLSYQLTHKGASEMRTADARRVIGETIYGAADSASPSP